MRNIVLMVNPPNTNDEILNSSREFNVDNSVTNGVEHTDWANFPHLGILSLASFIENETEFSAVYFDLVVCPIGELIEYIEQKKSSILSVCFSLLTANYETGQALAKMIKGIDPNIFTVAGNDHATFLSDLILKECDNNIDFIIKGNECFYSLKELNQQLSQHAFVRDSAIIPGLAYTSIAGIINTPQKEEEIYSDVNYQLIDKAYDHSSHYDSNFYSRLGASLKEMFGKDIHRGVPIELARGCLKFNKNDACSFCSIQYGGMWKNEISDASKAWNVIKNAYDFGYRYLYVTADELPLTFAKLIRNMHKAMPQWFKELPELEKPILMGYGRADGMVNKNLLQSMKEIGFGIIYIGIDAGCVKSLMAMKKHVNSFKGNENAVKLDEMNRLALVNAKNAGLKVKAGFVLGHIGFNRTLLDDNITSLVSIINNSKDSILSIDVELLSPEPGSLEYVYLTNPNVAMKRAEELELDIASKEILNSIAKKYQFKTTFDREDAINDYITAFMPDLDRNVLVAARNEIRDYCKNLGFVVGE